MFVQVFRVVERVYFVNRVDELTRSGTQFDRLAYFFGLNFSDEQRDDEWAILIHERIAFAFDRRGKHAAYVLEPLLDFGLGRILVYVATEDIDHELAQNTCLICSLHVVSFRLLRYLCKRNEN